jgi:hypothetical protein
MLSSPMSHVYTHQRSPPRRHPTSPSSPLAWHPFPLVPAVFLPPPPPPRSTPALVHRIEVEAPPLRCLPAACSRAHSSVTSLLRHP